MTVATSLFDRVQAAAEAVRGRSALAPEVGIILGTGLGGLAREIEVEAEVAVRRHPRASRCPRSRPTPASCCSAASAAARSSRCRAGSIATKATTSSR